MRILLWFWMISVMMIAPISKSFAQVAFQPSNCDFQAVFVSSPDIKTASMLDENDKPVQSVIASLDVILDGKPNLFRAECIVAPVPATLDEKLVLEDMKTIADGNHLKDAQTWVEKSASGELVGRARGQISDTVTNYVIDIRRYFSRHNIFDVWVGSPPDSFPSEGNLIFIKEVRLNGSRIN